MLDKTRLLVVFISVVFGLGLATAMASPDASVLGWRALDADEEPTPTEPAPLQTPTYANHGAYVSEVAHSSVGRTKLPRDVSLDPSVTPTATATPLPTQTPTPEADEEAGLDDDSDEPAATEDAEDEEATHDTHGLLVSETAKSTEPGPGHGAIVSAAARSDAGKRGPFATPEPTVTPDDGDDDLLAASDGHGKTRVKSESRSREKSDEPSVKKAAGKSKR